MKTLMIASSLALLLSQTGFAQETKDVAEGYVFFAPGVETPGGEGLAHMGVGGEVLFKGIGIGPEIGYLTPIRSFGDGIGVVSPNVSYHFGTGKVSPFVTGGYSLFFRSGHVNGFNFGGGVNYWLSNRTALRFEFRDNVIPEHNDVHFLGLRFGLSFR